MSDPVTNVELEDVLSSIRRLVSEDSRPDPDAQVAPRPAATGRLVLTPALRVPDSGASDAGAPEAGPDEDPARHAATLTARLLPAEEELAEAARRSPLVAVARTEPEADAGRDLRGAALSSTPAAAPEIPVDEVEEAPFIEVEEGAEDGYGDSTIADFFALKLRDTRPRAPLSDETPQPAAEQAEAPEGSLARKIAELEEMISRSTHDFEPERGEEAPAAIFRHQPVTPERDAEVPAGVTVEDEDPELASRPMPEPELVDEPFAFVGRPDEAAKGAPEIEPEIEPELAPEVSPEPEIAAEPESVEPEPLPDVAELAEADPVPQVRRPVKILRNPVWQRSQSNLRTDPPAEPLAESAGAGIAADAPAVDAALPAMDEAHLRALIAEVVREELQGALGERVGRNVRKLVRRELQRLLASDELD